MTELLDRQDVEEFRSEPAPGERVEGGISDAELEALALSTPFLDDPSAVADPSLLRRSTLPSAYLPGSMPGPHKPWQGVVAVLLIIAFLAITALGFCITYGQLSFA